MVDTKKNNSLHKYISCIATNGMCSCICGSTLAVRCNAPGAHSGISGFRTANCGHSKFVNRLYWYTRLGMLG